MPKKNIVKKGASNWNMPQGKLIRVKDSLPSLDELIMPAASLKLTIERVSNGFLIRNEGDSSITVFEDQAKTDFPDRESGYHKLWEIIEFFDLRGSKHDSKRLSVVFDEQGQE